MSIILIPTDAQSSKTDAGLDVLRRIFSCDSSREAALAALPARYTADSAIAYNTTYAADPPITTVYDAMFLMDIQVRETGIKLCEVDMTFNGTQTGDLPAPKHEAGQSVINAQAETAFGNLSITALTPTTTLTWFSDIQGQSPQTVGLPIQGSFYFLTSGIPNVSAKLQFSIGSTSVIGINTHFNTQVKANDVLSFSYNALPLGTSYGSSAVIVDHVVSDVSLIATTAWPIAVNAITFGTVIGVRGSSTLLTDQIQVIAIRAGLGFGSLFTGKSASQFGQVLINEYFIGVPIAPVESTEIVPGQFWKNVQRTSIQLFPLFT
jgi:hypothetical protein